MTAEAAGRAPVLPARLAAGDGRPTYLEDRPPEFRYDLFDVAGTVVGAYVSEARLRMGDLVAPLGCAGSCWRVVNVLGHAATVVPETPRPSGAAEEHGAVHRGDDGRPFGMEEL